MSIATTKAEAQLILEGISSIQAVYDYEIQQPSGFPCATIVIDGLSNTEADTSQNRHVYLFTVFLRESISDKSIANLSLVDDNNKQRAERILTGVLDDVVAAFDQAYTLNGKALYVYPTVGQPGYLATNNGWERYLSVSLQVAEDRTASV